ncbi:MAG TPA: hypothetical protein VHJ00_16910 [Bradyrhizobium sp.]|jgi:hypothetical protein|nr:hypothetical protein [Bradyrhizobium sp.]
MVGFPLLLIPIAIYNIVAWLMPDVPLTDPMFRLTLVSGAVWTITLSDILLALGVLLLLLEIMKGARPGSKYLTDHLLSLILFGAAAAEFVMWPKFGTSTFFLLALLAMVDFFGGIALRARRAVAVTTVSRRAAKPVDQPVEAPAPMPEPEPHIEPAPAAPAPVPAVPPAVSVAEQVLQEPPKPSAPQSAPPAAETIPSPELQPGDGSTPAPDAPQR